MSRKKNIRFILLLIILAAAVTGGGIYYFSRYRLAVFYYPYFRTLKFRKDYRLMNISELTEEEYTEKLSRNYFLGPLKYNLRLFLDIGERPDDIICVKEDQTYSLIIDFEESFYSELSDRNEKYITVIEGLLMTMKNNTDVSKIYFLFGGSHRDLVIGGWNLKYAIPVE